MSGRSYYGVLLISCGVIYLEINQLVNKNENCLELLGPPYLVAWPSGLRRWF